MSKLAFIVVLAVSRLAVADGGVDVVVGGDPQINSATEAAISTWLTKRSFQLAKARLPAAHATTLTDCLIIADLRCARSVVDVRATAGDVVAVLTVTSTSGANRSIQFSAYWIRKARDVVSVQRTCDGCTKELLPRTIDALMSDLARLMPDANGRVKVRTTPAGVLVLVDDAAIGVTPLEHEVPSGPHEVTLSRGHDILARRHIVVAPGTTAEVEVAVPAVQVQVQLQERRSRVVPAVLLTIGGTGIAAGATMYAIGGPTGNSRTYRDLRTPGIGVAAGGGALALVGVIWLARGGGPDSTPTVAMTPGGVIAGWTRSFP